ncbi:MAG TPA: hypothetical protein DCE47_22860 [Planctomycetaceae bacterium]|nr:hypothetical protein [Planctomycetaceae bacterium]
MRSPTGTAPCCLWFGNRLLHSHHPGRSTSACRPPVGIGRMSSSSPRFQNHDDVRNLGMSESTTLRSLLPRTERGCHFVAYGDCCIGPPEPGRGHEEHLAAVHRVMHQLDPRPQFVCFLGDLIWGLTREHGPNHDGDSLRQEWAVKLPREMKPLTDLDVPVFRIPGNHDTMTPVSEAVWKEVFDEIPQNGPEGQEGLTWFERRDELLIIGISVYAMNMGSPFTMMGGRVDCDWVDRILSEHSDAKFKFVLGHSPVHPVNGYTAPKWGMLPEFGEPFWEVLARHHVTAYLCSHVIAFDFQVHDGVPQITTGGAGTSSGPGGCMPAPAEYHHCVQLAVDDIGLRGQVLDTDGTAREEFQWPLPADGVMRWSFQSDALPPKPSRVLLTGQNENEAYPRIRVSLDGYQPRLNVTLYDPADVYPCSWHGPEIDIRYPFELTVAIDPAMGPGGVLARVGSGPYSSLATDEPFGYKADAWPENWEASTEIPVVDAAD